jgi:hypothetical protein
MPPSILGLLLLVIASVSASAQPVPVQVGDAFEIERSYSWIERGNTRQGEGRGRTAIVERVLAIRSDGVELEYDLPSAISAEDRAREWILPVRLFRPLVGPPQLLNRSALEARRDAWLRRGELPPEACGRWIFTWNAFKIECDPEAALTLVAGYRVDGIELREGETIADPQALRPGVLAASGPGSFAVELQIDPEAIRREQAEQDAVLAEITPDTPELRQVRDEILEERAGSTFSGTIKITFEQDQDGSVRRRIRIRELRTLGPAGDVTTEIRTATVERRQIPR